MVLLPVVETLRLPVLSKARPIGWFNAALAKTEPTPPLVNFSIVLLMFDTYMMSARAAGTARQSRPVAKTANGWKRRAAPGRDMVLSSKRTKLMPPEMFWMPQNAQAETRLLT